MANAEVGDDVYRVDPTVKALERATAVFLMKRRRLSPDLLIALAHSSAASGTGDIATLHRWRWGNE
jgi:hypothetical protein